MTEQPTTPLPSQQPSQEGTLQATPAAETAAPLPVENQDISSKTVVLLVVLALVVSFIGAWASIQQAMTFSPAQQPTAIKSAPASAEINFVIQEPKKSTLTAAMATFELKAPNVK